MLNGHNVSVDKFHAISATVEHRRHDAASAHTHDGNNPILWTLISCAALCISLIFVYSAASFYPLLSIPLFVYRLV